MASNEPFQFGQRWSAMMPLLRAAITGDAHALEQLQMAEETRDRALEDFLAKPQGGSSSVNITQLTDANGYTIHPGDSALFPFSFTPTNNGFAIAVANAEWGLVSWGSSGDVGCWIDSTHTGFHPLGPPGTKAARMYMNTALDNWSQTFWQCVPVTSGTTYDWAAGGSSGGSWGSDLTVTLRYNVLVFS